MATGSGRAAIFHLHLNGDRKTRPILLLSGSFAIGVGMAQIGSFSKQMECDMIYQLSLKRSICPTHFHSRLNDISKILKCLQLP